MAERGFANSKSPITTGATPGGPVDIEMGITPKKSSMKKSTGGKRKTKRRKNNKKKKRTIKRRK